jgi:hypothetical protein
MHSRDIILENSFNELVRYIEQEIPSYEFISGIEYFKRMTEFHANNMDAVIAYDTIIQLYNWWKYQRTSRLEPVNTIDLENNIIEDNIMFSRLASVWSWL